ncbi:hypothetical protein [Mycolicibacterium conceptionense]|uniref:Helix-turn-helix DNA binding domain protein n=1 Tax=Mycolicibacterium conceptionense TaxID=451644 RepID=A0A1A2V6U3_9MYCO|nr:hypothetical protein [Mycolicibacterium conceptionense]OBF14410.1 hypothetical protein A5726_24945 [Mycolicibacterium conceptionense]OBF31698.1 hypothetical protein A5720_28100 [Mycolicibacterium conceptionense]OBH97028.1 hypothetical protein A5716_16825 [Mycolicibacterium conceptionense]
MSACQVCEGRAQLFLCLTHITALREALHDLPWWLTHLGDAAVGNVRLGESGRRATRAHELDEYTGPNGADKLDAARRAGKFEIDKVLATGRVNGKASRLLDRARNELGTWIRHLCESRGADMPELGSLDAMAHWLEKHTQAIASDEAAKECYAAVVDLTDQIRRVVNRPEPPQYCGPCVTELSAEQRTKLVNNGQEDRTHCRVQLYARRGSRQVICPDCRTEHNVEELQDKMLAEADEYSFSVSDLADFILPKLGIGIPRRTLQHWAKVGDLVPSGFESTVARYQLAHVREVAGRKGRGR